MDGGEKEEEAHLGYYTGGSIAPIITHPNPGFELLQMLKEVQSDQCKDSNCEVNKYLFFCSVQ